MRRVEPAGSARGPRHERREPVALRCPLPRPTHRPVPRMQPASRAGSRWRDSAEASASAAPAAHAGRARPRRRSDRSPRTCAICSTSLFSAARSNGRSSQRPLRTSPQNAIPTTRAASGDPSRAGRVPRARERAEAMMSSRSSRVRRSDRLNNRFELYQQLRRHVRFALDVSLPTSVGARDDALRTGRSPLAAELSWGVRRPQRGRSPHLRRGMGQTAPPACAPRHHGERSSRSPRTRRRSTR